MTNPNSDEETVKVEVTLAWSYTTGSHDVEIDTEIPLSEWNAMTTVERDKLLGDLVDEEISNQFMGGTRVITEGAES